MSLHNLFVTSWYSNKRWLRTLLPLSYLYRGLFYCHKLVYKVGIKKVFHAPIPVIVIGNLTVGGTGKTPFTIELARRLTALGYKPGIISRGYKGTKSASPLSVNGDSDPRIVGDEPILLATSTRCPVVIGAKRAAAITMLLEHFDCDLILSDDGLQHHAINKDIEVLIIDGQRKLGNGYCLPAGPLREPAKKLSQVDFVVYHQQPSTQDCYSFSLITKPIYNLKDTTLTVAAHELNKKNLYAVAALGHPERFFNSLTQMGLKIVKYPFPDHHQYQAADFSFLIEHDNVILTEKDAVKCRLFATSQFWVLPVEAQISNGFIRDFLYLLKLNYSAKNVPDLDVSTLR